MPLVQHQTNLDWVSSIHVRKNWNLKDDSIIIVVFTSEFELFLIAECFEELFDCLERLSLVALSLLHVYIFIRSTKSKLVKYASPFWKDIEAKLVPQVSVQLVNGEACLSYD